MREEQRPGVPLDEAIDAALCDMMAKEAPAMLKARVLARLGDGVIDATLRDIAAREVPPTLRARVLTRLDEEPTRTDRARRERWRLVQPLLRPTVGLVAAALVVATALTAWLFRTPPGLAPGRERVGQVASQPDGAGGRATAGKGPRAQSEDAVADKGSPPGPPVTSAVVARGSRSAAPPSVTQLARRAATQMGVESADTAGGADDPLAIRPLRVEPLSVSRIAIPPIEIAPVEIAPAMSDTASGPPGESRSEPGTED